MAIAHELGRLESEILDLLPDELARWIAFFDIKYEREKEAIKKNRATGAKPLPSRSRRRR